MDHRDLVTLSSPALQTLLSRRACLRRLTHALGAAAAVPALVACGGGGDGNDSAPPATLRYMPDIRGPFPIPQSERGLHTVTAEPYFKVSDDALQLEGASFDRDGNLLFVDVFGGTIFRLTPANVLSTVLAPNALGSAGIAIHQDGRIFVAGLGNFVDTGSIFWIEPDGTGLTTVIPASAGYLPDDLVFGADGGFYFTDFRGTPPTPSAACTTCRPTSRPSRRSSKTWRSPTASA